MLNLFSLSCPLLNCSCTSQMHLPALCCDAWAIPERPSLSRSHLVGLADLPSMWFLTLLRHGSPGKFLGQPCDCAKLEPKGLMDPRRVLISAPQSAECLEQMIYPGFPCDIPGSQVRGCSQAGLVPVYESSSRWSSPNRTQGSSTSMVHQFLASALPWHCLGETVLYLHIHLCCGIRSQLELVSLPVPAAAWLWNSRADRLLPCGTGCRN